MLLFVTCASWLSSISPTSRLHYSIELSPVKSISFEFTIYFILTCMWLILKVKAIYRKSRQCASMRHDSWYFVIENYLTVTIAYEHVQSQFLHIKPQRLKIYAGAGLPRSFSLQRIQNPIKYIHASHITNLWFTFITIVILKKIVYEFFKFFFWLYELLKILITREKIIFSQWIMNKYINGVR